MVPDEDSFWELIYVFHGIQRSRSKSISACTPTANPLFPTLSFTCQDVLGLEVDSGRASQNAARERSWSSKRTQRTWYTICSSRTGQRIRGWRFHCSPKLLSGSQSVSGACWQDYLSETKAGREFHRPRRLGRRRAQVDRGFKETASSRWDGFEQDSAQVPDRSPPCCTGEQSSQNPTYFSICGDQQKPHTTLPRWAAHKADFRLMHPERKEWRKGKHEVGAHWKMQIDYSHHPICISEKGGRSYIITCNTIESETCTEQIQWDCACFLRGRGWFLPPSPLYQRHHLWSRGPEYRQDLDAADCLQNLGKAATRNSAPAQLMCRDEIYSHQPKVQHREWSSVDLVRKSLERSCCKGLPET